MQVLLIRAFKTNEDEAWIFGLFYYNPKDKSSIVETRAGIGTSVNMATGLGKGLTIFSIIAMLEYSFYQYFYDHGRNSHQSTLS